MEKENNRYGYIYITTNLINKKRYIGKHLYNSTNDKYYKGSGKLLKKAFKKYGIKNFKCEIIEWCKDKNQLNEREKYWISYYNAVQSSDFYNIASGGESSCFEYLSEEKIKEVKMKISSKLKGCKRSEATKLKQHNTFNSKTEEEKQLWRNKISNTSKGRKLKDYQIAKLIATTTKTSILNLNTGEYFPTIKDALLKYNFKKLQGKMFEIKKHYNYYWLFFPKNYKPDYSFIYDRCYKFFEDKILYYVEEDLYFYSVVELGKYLNKEDLTQLKTCIKNNLPIDSMNIRKCNHNELDTFIRNFLVNINT